MEKFRNIQELSEILAGCSQIVADLEAKKDTPIRDITIGIDFEGFTEEYVFRLDGQIYSEVIMPIIRSEIQKRISELLEELKKTSLSV